MKVRILEPPKEKDTKEETATSGTRQLTGWVDVSSGWLTHGVQRVCWRASRIQRNADLGRLECLALVVLRVMSAVECDVHIQLYDKIVTSPLIIHVVVRSNLGTPFDTNCTK